MEKENVATGECRGTAAVVVETFRTATSLVHQFIDWDVWGR